MTKIVILIIAILNSSNAVIYKLNEKEFYQMPPQFRIDEFDKCLDQPDGVYCSVEFALVSDTPSELLTTIQEYSKHTVRHFNHTKPYYGICLNKSCRNYIKDKTKDIKDTLERCLNESLWKEYKLKTEVLDNIQCTKHGEKLNIDAVDIAAVGLILFIIIINIIATVYDFRYIENKDKNANKYLINFSLGRNCAKLVDISDRSDIRQNCFRCLDALKTIMIILIIVGHSIFILALSCENVFFLESIHEYIGYQLILNGSIIVQIFFLISGLLLSYNLQIAAETKPMNWLEVPKRFCLRWLRLTPPYLVLLAIASTWWRFAGNGPFWKGMVNSVADDCRKYWWSHLLHINNYYDNNEQCMPHTWYVAADFQLHFIGLIVCVLCKGFLRKFVLACLFVFGVIAPAAHVYYQDLNGTLVVTFEIVRTLFVFDPTFNYVYRPAHTNVASFVIGLSLGLFIYSLQNSQVDIKKYKKYVHLYFVAIPAATCILFIGMGAYRDGPPLPVYTRMLFAAFLKPVFATCLSMFIFGAVFKFDNAIRGFLEARCWTVLCRLSFSAYLVHVLFFGWIAGSSILMRFNAIQVFNVTLGNVFMSYLAAALLYLFVEGPFLGIIDTIRAQNTPQTPNEKDRKTESNITQ